jgi:hypothetical protein
MSLVAAKLELPRPSQAINASSSRSVAADADRLDLDGCLLRASRQAPDERPAPRDLAPDRGTEKAASAVSAAGRIM